MANRIQTGRRRIVTTSKVFQPAAVGTDETTPLFPIKAGQTVLQVQVIPMIAAAGSTNSTMEIGDGTDPDGYIVATTDYDPEASVVGTLINGSGAYLAVFGKFYAADDTIDVVYTKNTAGATNPKIRVYLTYLA